MASSQIVLIFGATGVIGGRVFRDLLANDHFTKVIEAGRRVTSPEALASLPGKEKLVQRTIDFDNLEASNLKDEKADVVVITVSKSLLPLRGTQGDPVRPFSWEPQDTKREAWKTSRRLIKNTL